jgi:hypothetical protein
MNKPCECEHIAHGDMFGKPEDIAFRNRTTPNGNPGHKFGAKYDSSYLQTVNTIYGTYHVCRDCAQDCWLDERTLTK